MRAVNLSQGLDVRIDARVGNSGDGTGSHHAHDGVGSPRHPRQWHKSAQGPCCGKGILGRGMTCVVERDRLLGIAKPSIWVSVLWQPETLSTQFTLPSNWAGCQAWEANYWMNEGNCWMMESFRRGVECGWRMVCESSDLPVISATTTSPIRSRARWCGETAWGHSRAAGVTGCSRAPVEEMPTKSDLSGTPAGNCDDFNIVRQASDRERSNSAADGNGWLRCWRVTVRAGNGFVLSIRSMPT